MKIEKGAKVNFRNLYWTIIGQERKKILNAREMRKERGERWKMKNECDEWRSRKDENGERLEETEKD